MRSRSSSPAPRKIARPVATVPIMPAAPRPRVDTKGLIIRAAVFNIMDNAQYVLDACHCKMIMPSHLKAVAMIQNTITRNMIGKLPKGVKKTRGNMKGGGQVMAPQFFGVSNDRYFDISMVDQLETHMFADAALSRAEMPLKMGGGDQDSRLVTMTAVKKAIKEYNAAKEKTIKVNAEAVEMMRISVEQNLREVTRRVGKLTPESMQVLKGDPQFAHLVASM